MENAKKNRKQQFMHVSSMHKRVINKSSTALIFSHTGGLVTILPPIIKPGTHLNAGYKKAVALTFLLEDPFIGFGERFAKEADEKLRGRLFFASKKDFK